MALKMRLRRLASRALATRFLPGRQGRAPGRCGNALPVALTTDHLRRIGITTSCHDCDDLPKVPGAGEVVYEDSGAYQLMHNGLRVEADAYCGPWMTELIRRLRGHHEPQEERVFDLLVGYCRPATTMIELGSGWAFYSMWYAQRIAGARLVCVEPDPTNLASGERNMRSNGMAATFLRAAVGRNSRSAQPFDCESGVRIDTPQICVDDLVTSERIEQVEMLLADIQGAELAMLEGARRTIDRGRLRFVVVATHHHSISNDPLTHQRCLAWIRQHGGHVLAEFNVGEGFAGDGMIAASFHPPDASLPVINLTRNHSSNGMFRELEYDLAQARVELAKYQSRSARPWWPFPTRWSKASQSS